MRPLADIFLSIIVTEDPSFIEKKLEILENQLKLNEVDKRIIIDIRENLQLGDIVTPAYMRDKYSYYFNDDDEIIPVNDEYLHREAIDSAIVAYRVKQLKNKLANDVLDLGGKIDTMTPSDIKIKLSELHTNALIESKYEVPKDSLVIKEDAYGDLFKSRGGLSLLLPNVERHAGKASLGTTVSILAAPGHFKSAYALNIAYANAMAGHNMLYLTLEDTADKLTMRLVLNHIAITAKNASEMIDSSLLRDGKVPDNVKDHYNDKHNEMIEQLDGHLVIWDTDQFYYDTFLDMEDTLRKADKLFKDRTGKGLEAVFVDHVSLLKYTSGSGKKYGYDGAVINDWMLFFNMHALNFLDEGRHIVFFPLSQVRREAFSAVLSARKKGRYELDCAADSSEIERISTTMITLFKDPDTRGTLIINIPKAREGFVPENPLLAEVYGEYFHVGELKNVFISNIKNEYSESFNDDDVTLEQLIS